MTGETEAVTIVMVEDDPGHARLIEKNIRRAGVCNPIMPFESGTAVLDYLLGPEGAAAPNKSGAFLLLLDLNLPDMSGVDILKRIKGTPQLHRVPVIVLTTTDDKAEVERCYDLGCNVYITKPVSYDAFSNAIRQLGLFFSVMTVPESQ
jgi:CheY-like chemotaxis protein